jgi:DNA-binding transcriptional LysR family regulator
LLPVIEYLFRRYPKVQISMHASACGDPLAGVREGRLDCAFFVDSAGGDAEHLDTQVLCSEPLVLVGGPDHPLAGRARPTDAELRGAMLIRADRARYHRQFEQAISLDAAASGPRIFDLDSVDAAKQSVAMGMSMALLPRIAVARGLARGRLSRIDWTPPFAAFTQLVRRRDSGSNAALNALVSAAVRVVRDERVAA